MNLTSLIIGICFLALFIGPGVYVQLAQKKRNNQLKQTFSSIAKKYSFSIDDYDLWSNKYVLGIDKNTRSLLFLKDQQDELFIDLKRIGKCRIEDFKSPEIRRLELIFTYVDKNIPDAVIEFYNSDEQMSLNGEKPLIEKWLKHINLLIKNNKIKKHEVLHNLITRNGSIMLPFSYTITS